MQTKPKFAFYATLLDSYTNYLNSYSIWEQYWGYSDNPPHTPEEFKVLQFHSLIDRINRVPFTSEAADKGTAFNELIDCLIENRDSDSITFMVQSMPETSRRNVDTYAVRYNDQLFYFRKNVCDEFKTYFKNALTQQRVEAILPTAYGDVLVYGVIDELMPTSVHDIKTTGSYLFPKFKGHWQHIVYPYCLLQNGNDIHLFEYNITDFKNTYTESYTFVENRDIPKLKAHVEDFIEFILANKELITDKKIFGEYDY